MEPVSVLDIGDYEDMGEHFKMITFIDDNDRTTWTKMLREEELTAIMALADAPKAAQP